MAITEDNTDAILDKIDSAIQKTLKEIGVKGVARVKANAPVDTGKLRSSYTYELDDFSVTIGTNLDYSVYVEFKPSNRGGRPHFRNTLESEKTNFMNILKKNLGGIK